MSLASYLPSSHFSTIAGSLTLAAALIIAAQYVTRAPQPAPSVAVDTNAVPAQDWRSALDAIQAQAPHLPPTPGAEVTATLLQGAQSSNVTDTVARSLLVNLTDASSQGLGADTPTQNSIIAAAVARLPAAEPAKVYKTADLTIVADSKDAQKAYGNAVMVVFGKHQGATSVAVLGAVSAALDGGTEADLAPLADIEANYAGLAADMARVAVPRSLVPLHLQAINSISTIVSALADARYVIKDPLRGLQGLQQYQLRLGEVGRVLTAIATSLNKGGILFTKDEPGAAWAVFIGADTP